MKILCISDTHGLHEQIIFNNEDKSEISRNQKDSVDMIIHSGDFCNNISSKQECLDFIDWFSKVPCKYKILIAGNHDSCLDSKKMHSSLDLLDIMKEKGIIYLNNESIIVEGLSIYGFPYSFNRSETEYSSMTGYWGFAYNDTFNKNVFDKLESFTENLDILITHEPPKDILDSYQGENFGSERLLNLVKKLKPRLHVFGHIHDSHGTKTIDGIQFVNASMCGKNNPILINL